MWPMMSQKGMRERRIEPTLRVRNAPDERSEPSAPLAQLRQGHADVRRLRRRPAARPLPLLIALACGPERPADERASAGGTSSGHTSQGGPTSTQSPETATSGDPPTSSSRTHTRCPGRTRDAVVRSSRASSGSPAADPGSAYAAATCASTSARAGPGAGGRRRALLCHQFSYAAGCVRSGCSSQSTTPRASLRACSAASGDRAP